MSKKIELTEHHLAMLNWEIHWARQTAGWIALEVVEADKVVSKHDEYSRKSRKILRQLAVFTKRLQKEFEIRREIALRSTAQQIRADRLHSIFTTEVQERMRNSGEGYRTDGLKDGQ